MVLKEYNKIYEVKSDTDTSEFKSWFGQSKIKDSSGKPLVCYHASYSLQSAIEKKRLIFNTTSDKDIGSHFGSLEHANSRVKDLKDIGKVGKRQNFDVIQVYLKIKNPIVLHDIMDWGNPNLLYHNLLSNKVFDEKSLDKTRTQSKNVKWKWLYNLKELIISNGYDGVEYINTYESSMSKNENSYIVFNSNQIKSAYDNDGSYDISDDNIYS